MFACTRKERQISRAGHALPDASSCATAAARSWRGRSATPTCSPGASSAASSCACAAASSASATSCRSSCGRSRAPRARRPIRPLPAGELPRPRRARRLPRAPRAGGLRPRPGGAAGAAARGRASCGPSSGAPRARCPRPAGAGRARRRTITPISAACSSTPWPLPRWRSSCARCTRDSTATCCCARRSSTTSARRASSPTARRSSAAREGALLGHVELGLRLIAAHAPAGLVGARRLALEHCVLLHHGAEPGSGRRFASAEALALYRLNALDAGLKARIRARDRGLRLSPSSRSRGPGGLPIGVDDGRQRHQRSIPARQQTPPSSPRQRPMNGVYPPRHTGRSARMIGEVVVDLGFADRESGRGGRRRRARRRAGPTGRGAGRARDPAPRPARPGRRRALRPGLRRPVRLRTRHGSGQPRSAPRPPSATRPCRSASPTTARCCWRWRTPRTSSRSTTSA